jgi:hypothetical protein
VKQVLLVYLALRDQLEVKGELAILDYKEQRVKQDHLGLKVLEDQKVFVV